MPGQGLEAAGSVAIEAIPSLSLDTSALPPAEQFAHWAAHSPHTVLAPVRAGPFLARGTLWHLGSLCVSETVLDPFSSERSPDLVHATAADFVQLVMLSEGAVRFEADGVRQRCVAPASFVRDYGRPSTVVAESRLHAIAVYFARSFLEQAAGTLAFDGGLLPWNPETAVLARTLRLMVDSLPSLAPSSAENCARVLRDLLAAVLHRESRTRLAAGTGRREALDRVKAHIAAAAPGSVSVAGLVSTLGMSRSVLFGLFRAHGGVMAYDRLRRLRALHRDLENPAERAGVAELGARHGFLDKTLLSRSFRRAFGRSPQEVRRRRNRLASDDPLSARVREAIEQATG